MNKICLLLALCLPINQVFSDQPDLWLVTDHHPEVIQELNEKAVTHFDSGRIKVVELKDQGKSLSAHVREALQPVEHHQFRVYQPKFKLAEPNPVIKELIDGISLEKYRENLRFFSSHSDRSSRKLSTTENSGNWQATQWLQQKFEELGLETSLQCYKMGSPQSECNVVAVLPAAVETNETILVEAHLDDVGHAQAGADDNASGAVALLSMAEALSSVRLSKKIIFLATNGEEISLNGSEAYVRLLEQEGRLGDIKFVINMDMIGYNRGNNIMEIETNKEFETQANWYAERVQAYTSLIPEITIPAWGSDHVPFLNKGIPTVLTIEDWQTKTPCYHRSCDKEDTINYEYAIQIVKLNVAVTAELGGI